MARRRYSSHHGSSRNHAKLILGPATVAAKPEPDGTQRSAQPGKMCGRCPVCGQVVRVIKAPFNDTDNNILIGHPIFSKHTDTGMKTPTRGVGCPGSITPLGHQRYEIYMED